ncbi:MAG: hypothetical protein LQ345_004571 [Seirophora villosa]|nr:MAG: hypothetical protein LQ345_004571 [Seirophora villosa]
MPGKCFSKGQLERIIISQAIISIISDFFLSAFPILILRKVKINFRSKVGLCLLMGLGVITVLNYQNVTNDPTWLSVPNCPEEPNTRSNRSWPRLKKYLTASANKSNTDGQASASVPGSDMILPLQRFSGTGGDHEKAVEQEMHSGFDKGLHIHGDLEIHRSGNPKLERWDSEAQIGGTDGIKEVEDRI